MCDHQGPMHPHQCKVVVHAPCGACGKDACCAVDVHPHTPANTDRCNAPMHLPCMAPDARQHCMLGIAMHHCIVVYARTSNTKHRCTLSCACSLMHLDNSAWSLVQGNGACSTLQCTSALLQMHQFEAPMHTRTLSEASALPRQLITTPATVHAHPCTLTIPVSTCVSMGILETSQCAPSLPHSLSPMKGSLG